MYRQLQHQQIFVRILRRKSLLKHIIEGEIREGLEVTERQGRRRKQLLDHRKEMIGYRKLREEVFDNTL